jgi:hypothetical protein
MPWHEDFNKLQSRFDELQKHYEKFAKITTIILIILICINFGLGGIQLYVIGEIKTTQNENRKAVGHLCKTSNGVANILNAAAVNFKTNLDAGVYQRQVEEGKITQEQLDSAKRDYVLYTATVKSLRAPENPCEKVTGEPSTPTTTGTTTTR